LKIEIFKSRVESINVILSKQVTRDKALREWVMEETGKDVGRSFGSGYPGDPDTKSWLEQNSNPVFGFPSVVRFSWATCKPYFTKGGVDIFWLASPISTCPPDFVSCKYVGSDPLCLDCGPMVLIGLCVPLVAR
jgi:hypothetical protein